MRAWLLLLAVLATFQPIVQVASTEDITSRFIQAISSPSINQQKQRQQTNFEYVENKRDARNSFNTQQLTVSEEEEEKSSHVTAVSPVIDITALSVTKSAASIGARSNQKSTATTTSTTSIATIFSSSDSDNSKNNNKNNLNYKFSAKKDNSASKSGNTSDAAKANEIVELSEVKQKYKQIKHQNHNEVNEKSAKNTLVDPTKRNSAVTTQANKVPQQQLENTEESSAVISDEEEVEVEKANEQEKELQDLSVMAFEENTIATAQEAHEEHSSSSSSSKPHRHHKKYHQNHQQQEHNQHHHHHHQQHHHHHHHHRQHQDTQQQHLQNHHKTTHAEVKNVTEKISSATEERLAAEERLALKASETPKERFALPAVEAASSTTHKAAAEKLALDSARSSVDGSSTEFSKPASHTATAASITSTASMSSSDTAAMDASSDSVDSNESDSDSDNDNDNEPATYSNKEIIGEKLKPDPSTLVQIENSLLSLFNMKRPPKIDRSKIIIPEAMKQLYAQIMGYEWDSVMIPRPGILTKSANTVRSFTHIESKIDDRFPHHHRFRLYFDVKSIPKEEKLRAAELHLSRDAISDAVFNERLANRTRYQVLAYDITRVGVRGKREPSYLLLDNKAVHLNSTETVSLDVQPAVDRWLATPKKNYGLLIEVRTSPSLKPAPHHHVRLRRSVDEPNESWQHKQPVLYTYTDDGKHKSRSIRDTSSRSKRAGHHRRAHRRKNSDEICRRHSLYVDFADVGWSDWIVAPPGYDAFYCQGKCPFPLAEHMNSTNHAVVQTLVNNLNPGKVPKACCVPTQLEGISMLYLNDQNTVVLKNYQDMTVVGCGCR